MTEKNGEVEGKSGKTIDIKQQRQKRAEKEIKQDSGATTLKRKDVFVLYANLIDGKGPARLGRFPSVFHAVLMPDRSRKIIAVDDEKVCRMSSVEEVATEIAQYWKNEAWNIEDLWLDVKQATACAQYWLAYTEAIDMPKAVAWKSEDCLTFHRLPFDYEPKTNFSPMLFEICERMTNSDAFMMFFGSLFFQEADRQQYPWLYGEGNDGKGAIARLLERIFKPVYCSLVPPDRDKHWTQQLEGKRVGVFPDCGSTTFTTGGLFKSLSGNDPIVIDPKGKPAYTTRINTKFIFLSNERPALSSERADLRRIIYCELKSIEGEPDPTYEDRLWAEAKDFVGCCVDMYLDHVAKKGHAPVPVDPNSLNELSSEEDDYFDSVFDRYFEATTISSEFALPSKVGAVLDDAFKDKRERSKFRNWLQRRLGMKKVSYRCPTSGKVEKRYSGIRIKQSTNLLAPRY